ncbi:REP element-mobilizing transposase RayT [Mucilaginibacter gracilis]|uniref:REP element-mobilizing transposase RayT n=1 Tax=Mucilaginibacter gracilis TaxID=423350 RepID=A0A495J915_9SPHI|nr:hypothetical protein [Mucilaginibacter gracilis]RKR85495.1 REP element-mobilizing transposase RayT [Mucilaginibacter gracilis]
MAKTEHYYTQFEEGRFYHIYNRTIDKQPMFKNDGNFEFFLKKYDEYLSDVIDTYAYCLLGNHFHILIRISQELPSDPENGKSTHDIVSHQFRKFFQSYAMAFNKQQQRIGTLFQTPFKRALVESETYFSQLVYYIHANPQQHGLINDFRAWKWSSYERMLLEKNTKLKKQEVLNWFGNKDYYKQYHDDYQKMLTEQKLILDDD